MLLEIQLCKSITHFAPPRNPHNPLPLPLRSISQLTCDIPGGTRARRHISLLDRNVVVVCSNSLRRNNILLCFPSLTPQSPTRWRQGEYVRCIINESEERNTPPLSEALNIDLKLMADLMKDVHHISYSPYNIESHQFC